jgi:hypothetical protein
VSNEAVQHILKLIEIEYRNIEIATKNIEKWTKRIELLVGVNEAARLISEVFGSDPEKTQPLEGEQ